MVGCNSVTDNDVDDSKIVYGNDGGLETTLQKQPSDDIVEIDCVVYTCNVLYDVGVTLVATVIDRSLSQIPPP